MGPTGVDQQRGWGRGIRHAPGRGLPARAGLFWVGVKSSLNSMRVRAPRPGGESAAAAEARVSRRWGAARRARARPAAARCGGGRAHQMRARRRAAGAGPPGIGGARRPARRRAAWQVQLSGAPPGARAGGGLAGRRFWHRVSAPALGYENTIHAKWAGGGAAARPRREGRARAGRERGQPAPNRPAPASPRARARPRAAAARRQRAARRAVAPPPAGERPAQMQ